MFIFSVPYILLIISNSFAATERYLPCLVTIKKEQLQKFATLICRNIKTPREKQKFFFYLRIKISWDRGGQKMEDRMSLFQVQVIQGNPRILVALKCLLLPEIINKK